MKAIRLQNFGGKVLPFTLWFIALVQIILGLAFLLAPAGTSQASWLGRGRA